MERTASRAALIAIGVFCRTSDFIWHCTHLNLYVGSVLCTRNHIKNHIKNLAYIPSERERSLSLMLSFNGMSRFRSPSLCSRQYSTYALISSSTSDEAKQAANSGDGAGCSNGMYNSSVLETMIRNLSFSLTRFHNVATIDAD